MPLVSSVIDAVLWVYTALAVVPFVPFLLVWAAVYWYKKEKKLAIKRAMDVTTALLVGVVAGAYNVVFQSDFGFYLLLLLFLTAFGLLGNLQQRTKGSFDWKKSLRAVWRLGFVGLSAAYVILMTIGITKNLL